MKLKNILASALFVELTILTVIAAYRFIDLKSTVLLVAFDFFFISITFQLNGSLSRKLGLLALGSMLGFVWNYAFLSFDYVGVAFFGNIFELVYDIIYPFIGSIWMVTFWSLSLTVLPKPTGLQAERPRLDN
jgi:hypothetical protein